LSYALMRIVTRRKCRAQSLQGGRHLPFFVKGTDTSGTISLRRDNAAAAVKKAKELMDDGCWDIEITGPDGHAHELAEFEAQQTAGADRAG
jgi:maltooligosyltrehalose synthase